MSPKCTGQKMLLSTERWTSAAGWRVLADQPPFSLWYGTGTEKILEAKCWCTYNMMACWSTVKRGSAGACTVTIHPLQTLFWSFVRWRWRMLACTGAGWQSGSCMATQASGSTKHPMSPSLWCSQCCLQVSKGSICRDAGSGESLCSLFCFPSQLCFVPSSGWKQFADALKMMTLHFSQ